MTPDQVSSVVITDCGSTTTKAILIEKVDGEFRQTFRGEAPTTVEAPLEDVTVGVRAALRDLSALCGRRLVDAHGGIIRPSGQGQGVDLYLSTSSAGGGLQMLVLGMVRRISVESAQRAALGAGAIVADVVAYDDPLAPHEKIDRVRRLRPDMVLLAGGVDGGAEVPVIELAELLVAANPRPRFGEGFRLPVVFAGNKEIAEKTTAVLGRDCELSAVDNVRPDMDTEALGPAREKIHDLFLEHVMRQAPGFSRLLELTDSPVMPTPLAVGEILMDRARHLDVDILCVDIGGATTDIFSVVQGRFSRTVSANLGLSYSAANVLAEAGVDNLMRWVPFPMDPREMRNAIMNKTIRPTTVPDSLEELLLEQALAREALFLSFMQHRAFATGLKGLKAAAGIDQVFAAKGGDPRTAPLNADLIIGSGGVLSHAPEPAQTAAMLVDAFQPPGITRLAKDSIFMMPHLGVLLGVVPQAARSAFERDCIEELGTCVAPTGKFRKGRVCLEYSLKAAQKSGMHGQLRCGELVAMPLALGEIGDLELRPAAKFDVGAGRAKRWTGKVRGGPAGLILDGRGRPIQWPEDPAERSAMVQSWFEIMGVIDRHGER